MPYKFRIDGETVTRDTLAELSAEYCRRRDDSYKGASEFPAPKVYEVGCSAPFARFSYNGRIWRDQPWTPEAKPIYDNRSDGSAQ